MKRWIHAKTDLDSNIKDIWFIQSDDGADNCCIDVEGYNKCMRGRSAMICLKKEDSQIYVLCRPNENDYGVPGGGWNRNESPKDAAIRELHEETFTDVKNVRRFGTLIEYQEEVADWVKEHVPDPDDWWYGYYSTIFVGEYSGDFYGHVDEDDLESGYHWEDVSDVFLKFPVEYRNAITAYINNYLED